MSAQPESTSLVVGLMSGTSLDGVDAACCRVSAPQTSDPTDYDLVVEGFVTVPYPQALRDALLELCTAGSVDAVCRMNVGLARRFADAAERATAEAGYQLTNIDLLASHGQTIRHRPDPVAVPGCDAPVGSTLQIGDADVLAAELGVPTVADFRAADVAVGGQGAPITPIFDLALLGHDTEFRAVQNVGGIGNCTLLPPSPDRSTVQAFDTGPGNMVVDGAVELLTDGEATFDEDGALAAAGTVDSGLVASFLETDYFTAEPPKTTGREEFGHDYVREFVAAGRERGCADEDLVASATMLTARSIADAYERFAPTYPDRAIVSGGGTENPTLMGMLRVELDCPVDPVDDHGVRSDAKEAALMALLGRYRVDGVPGNVPSATGADRAVVMGKRSGVHSPSQPED